MKKFLKSRAWTKILMVDRFISCQIATERGADSLISRSRIVRPAGRHSAAAYSEFCDSMNGTLALLDEKLVIDKK